MDQPNQKRGRGRPPMYKTEEERIIAQKSARSRASLKYQQCEKYKEYKKEYNKKFYEETRKKKTSEVKKKKK